MLPSFSVVLEGGDLLSEDVQGRLAEAGSGIDSEGFDDAVFGREHQLQLAVFDCSGATYKEAVDEAVTRLVAVLPEFTVVEVTPGRFGSLDIL